MKTKRRIENIAKAIEVIRNDPNSHSLTIYDDFNGRIKSDQSVIGTLTTNIGSDALGNGTKLIEIVDDSVRVRKITPKESFRLMGFDDEAFYKAASVVSNTQLYKQAGNSIVVPVIQQIISNLVESGLLSIMDSYTKEVC